MRKITYSLMTMWLLMSCSEIKKDAQTIADLKCLAIDAHGDKKERYEQQIDIISIKYSGSDLVELEKTADELFKKCPAKIKEDKENAEFEKEMKEMDKKSFSDSISSDSSNINDYDKLLDDYEDYMNEYLTLYRKSLNGDASAMSKYPELMQKAENLQKSLEEADKNGQLNDKQMKRLNNLLMEYMDALPNG